MKTRSIIYLVIYALVVALDHILQKMVLNAGVDRFIFAFLRIATGFFLITALLLSRKYPLIKLVKQNIRHFIVLGVFYSGCGILLKFWGLSSTTATNASFVMSLSSVTSVFFAFWLLKEKASKSFYFIVIWMTAGVYLFTTGGKRPIPRSGDLIILILAFLIGFMQVYGKKLLNSLSVLETSFGRFFMGMLFLGLAALVFAPQGFSTIAGFRVISLIIANGLVFIASTILFYMALRSEGASNTSMFNLLTPVFTAALGYWLLAEMLNGWQFIGGFFILAGSFLVSRLPIKTPAGGNP